MLFRISRNSIPIGYVLCVSCRVNFAHSGVNKVQFSYRSNFCFTTPMTWRQPLNHTDDCYFCLSKLSGVGRSAIWNHVKVFSVTFPKAFTIPENFTCVDTDETCDSNDSETLPNLEKLSQKKLNDLIRDLELTKEKSEFLSSRMKQHGFLNPNVTLQKSPRKIFEVLYKTGQYLFL